MRANAKMCGNRDGNKAKVARIMEILDDGLRVDVRINACFCDEKAAYLHEHRLINIDRGSLTNGSSGQDGGDSYFRALLARVIPFDRWVEKNSPSEYERSLYWKTVEGLKGLLFKSEIMGHE